MPSPPPRKSQYVSSVAAYALAERNPATRQIRVAFMGGGYLVSQKHCNSVWKQTQKLISSKAPRCSRREAAAGSKLYPAELRAQCARSVLFYPVSLPNS